MSATRGASGERLYEAFVQDTNMYDPMAMWIEEGKALTVDVYDGDKPLGRVVVSVATFSAQGEPVLKPMVVARVEPLADRRPDAEEPGRFHIPGPS